MNSSQVLRRLLSDDMDATPSCLARDLLSTDRILQRWAVSVGSGLPTEVWDDVPRAKPPPLPDDVAIIVDRIVIKSPKRKRLLIKLWYRRTCPRSVISKRLNMTQRALYVEVAAALMYLKLRFLSAGHAALCDMVKYF